MDYEQLKLCILSALKATDPIRGDIVGVSKSLLDDIRELYRDTVTTTVQQAQIEARHVLALMYPQSTRVLSSGEEGSIYRDIKSEQEVDTDTFIALVIRSTLRGVNAFDSDFNNQARATCLLEIIPSRLPTPTTPFDDQDSNTKIRRRKND